MDDFIRRPQPQPQPQPKAQQPVPNRPLTPQPNSFRSNQPVQQQQFQRPNNFPNASPQPPQPRVQPQPAPNRPVTGVTQPAQTAPNFQAPTNVNAPKKRRLPLKKLLIAAGVVALVAGAVISFMAIRARDTSRNIRNTINLSLASKVDFPIYYPNPKTLPKDYTIDVSSFRSPAKNGITYTLFYQKTKRVTFSLQSSPTEAALKTFRNTYITNPFSIETNLGNADTGTKNGITLASIVIDDGPWITISAPDEINAASIKTLINSLQKY